MAKFDLNKLASKAKDIVDKSGDKIASGVDKVTDKLDEKTKGKYHDKLEKVDAAAQKLDKSKRAEAAEAAEGQPTATSGAPDDGQPADPTPSADQPTAFPEPN